MKPGALCRGAGECGTDSSLATCSAFTLGKANSNTCGVYSSITTEAACQAAATQLGYTWFGSMSFDSVPTGCSANTQAGGVAFNTHPTGAANADGTPVCVGSSAVYRRSSRRRMDDLGISPPPSVRYRGRRMTSSCDSWVAYGKCTDADEIPPECVDECLDAKALEAAALETAQTDAFFATDVWTMARLRMMRLAHVNNMRNALRADNFTHLRDKYGYGKQMEAGKGADGIDPIKPQIPRIPFIETRLNFCYETYQMEERFCTLGNPGSLTLYLHAEDETEANFMAAVINEKAGEIMMNLTDSYSSGLGGSYNVSEMAGVGDPLAPLRLAKSRPSFPNPPSCAAKMAFRSTRTVPK